MKEARDRAGVEVIVFDRVGTEQLQPIAILDGELGEAGRICGYLHAEVL